MNPFLIMMASAKENAAMKKTVPIAPKVVQKGKLGRPPALRTEKIPVAPLPAVVDTKNTTVETVRRKNYDTGVSKEMMEKALLAVIQAGGCHIRRTAEVYGVSHNSLVARYKASIGDATTVSRKRGNKCTLPSEVEENLSLFCRYMASCNLAIDRTQLNISAIKLSLSCGISSFKASKTWASDFMERHKLSQRLCLPWEHARQAHTNKILISEFFAVIQEGILRCERDSGELMEAGDVFNLDETGFDRNIAKNRMVIVKKHSRRVRSLSSGSGAHVTMLNCIHAAGVALKPYLIMRGEGKPKIGTKGVNKHGNSFFSVHTYGLLVCHHTRLPICNHWM